MDLAGRRVPAPLVALVVTQSRNAWSARSSAWLACCRSELETAGIAVPSFSCSSPARAGAVQDRAFSTFDPANITNLDRVSMLKSGAAMIADHPFVGVGPNMVEKAYGEKYKRADALDPVDKPGSSRAHLHNVPLQIAAERPAGARRLAVVRIRRRPGSLAADLRGPARDSRRSDSPFSWPRSRPGCSSTTSAIRNFSSCSLD